MSRVPDEQKIHPDANAYCIVRIDGSTSEKESLAPRWVVNIKRHGQLFARNFQDGTYGGKQAAWLMAEAYRDALIRLVPPYTRRELKAMTRVSNKSGTTGVSALVRKGRIQAWRANLSVSGVTHSRYFSVKEHGDQAKALAIAARQELVDAHPDKFATFHEGATQIAETVFSHLLDRNTGVAAPVDAQALKRQVRCLDEWFDALRPRIIHFRLSVYNLARRGHIRPALFVVVGDGAGRSAAKKSKDAYSWMIKLRPFKNTLRLAWSYTETKVIERFGVDCWREFERLYKSTVLGCTADKALLIRHRFESTQRACEHDIVPAELASALEGFRIPTLLPQEGERVVYLDNN